MSPMSPDGVPSLLRIVRHSGVPHEVGQLHPVLPPHDVVPAVRDLQLGEPAVQDAVPTPVGVVRGYGEQAPRVSALGLQTEGVDRDEMRAAAVGEHDVGLLGEMLVLAEVEDAVPGALHLDGEREVPSEGH